MNTALQISPTNSCRSQETTTRPYLPLKETNPKEFENLMHAFFQDYCIPCLYTFKEVLNWIRKGEDLVIQLQNRAHEKTRCTNEEAQALIWFLTAQEVASKEEFYDGMRLIPGREVFNFLSTHPKSYYRISTHYNESSNRFQHKGIDLRNMGLPSHKHSILFGLRINESTFIKLEEHGCPPFWKKGFKSLKNIKEFVGHSIDYVRSRTLTTLINRIVSFILSRTLVFFRTLTTTQELRKHRIYRLEEKVNSRIARKFKAAIESIESFNKFTRRSLIKEGLSIGLGRIYSIITEAQRIHKFNKNFQAISHKRALEKEKLQAVLIEASFPDKLTLLQIMEKDRERGVHDLQRKSEEVILPLYLN